MNQKRFLGNKRAWLRIMEAVISILMVASVLVFVVLRVPASPDLDKEIHEMQRLILKQISLNNTLREEILQKQTTETEKFVEYMVPTSWSFMLMVCEINDTCMMSNPEIKKEVYADQILISSTLQQYSPKKLKFFVWLEK